MNIKRKIVFVHNPNSGSYRLIPVIPIIERFVNRDLYDYKIISTEYKGHAKELAQEYAFFQEEQLADLNRDFHAPH